MFDLQQLRYFVAVAETGHVGRAAERVHISQSPLSRQLQQLEARTGLDLFAREKKRLWLTAQGHEFLVEARRLLAQADRLAQHARDAAAGDEGTLVVAHVAAAVHAGVLATALRRFRLRAPRARLRLRAMRSAEQLQALREGAIDIGFAHAAADGDDLASTPLLDEPFLLAVPPGHALAAPRARLDLRRLDDEPFVSFDPVASPQAHARLISACAAAGFSPRIVQQAGDPLVALGLVHAGIGFAMVQQAVRRAAPEGVVLRRLPADFGWRLALHRVASAAPRPLALRMLG